MSVMWMRMIHTEIFECGLIISVSRFDTADDELVLIKMV